MDPVTAVLAMGLVSMTAIMMVGRYARGGRKERGRKADPPGSLSLADAYDFEAFQRYAKEMMGEAPGPSPLEDAEPPRGS